MLLQNLYTIRSARLLMEQLDYNLLFRRFVGLSLDDKLCFLGHVLMENRWYMGKRLEGKLGAGVSPVIGRAAHAG